MIHKSWKTVPVLFALALPVLLSAQTSEATNKITLAIRGDKPQPIPPTDPTQPPPDSIKPIRMAQARSAMYFHQVRFNSDGTVSKEVKLMCEQTLAVPVYDFRQCHDSQKCFADLEFGAVCTTDKFNGLNYIAGIAPYISLRDREVIPGESLTSVKSFDYSLVVGAMSDDEIPVGQKLRALKKGNFEFYLENPEDPITPPVGVNLGFRSFAGTKDLQLVSAVNHSSVELGGYDDSNPGEGNPGESKFGSGNPANGLSFTLPPNIESLRDLKDGETRRLGDDPAPPPMPMKFSWIEVHLDTEDKQ